MPHRISPPACRFCCWLLAAGGLLHAGESSANEALVHQEFLYESAPFPECHASTLVETANGLVASWFGGTHEKHPDVSIWVSRQVDGTWSAPLKVADGIQPDGKQLPCWNPVLFQPPGEPLQLYYKVGPSPGSWWGMLKTSRDSGIHWSDASRLPAGMLGPVRNKPTMLKNGRILHGTSDESEGWVAYMETSRADATDWKRSAALNRRDEFGAIQPTMLRHGGGRLQALFRTRQSVIAQSWSDDDGATWSSMTATSLPNPNSGIDAVTMQDGRHVLVYNHTTRDGEFPRGREMLNVAVSQDGVLWKAAGTLERQPGEYSYPAVIQTNDGLVHTTYTYQRKKIKHVVIDPNKLVLHEFVDGKWPAAANAAP